MDGLSVPHPPIPCAHTLFPEGWSQCWPLERERKEDDSHYWRRESQSPLISQWKYHSRPHSCVCPGPPPLTAPLCLRSNTTHSQCAVSLSIGPLCLLMLTWHLHVLFVLWNYSGCISFIILIFDISKIRLKNISIY